MWFIWKHHCWCVFNHQSPHPSMIAMKAYSAALDFLDFAPSKLILQPPISSVSYTTTIDTLSPPPALCFKVNIDASWNENSVSGGIAVVVRDDMGRIIDGFVGISPAISPLAAELLAICEGLVLIAKLPPCSVMLASDSITLIQALKSGIPPQD
ncbi:putative ribonuclease H-like domain-containing protein [Rosa chinensis]|uniref:Putative ribonuclease H-like domain-containing protein n=1 Tax=Rosa chinensis TaxID=74649 RepID=A0A2P6PNS9_ROSCH|nr:putative ribonuclease H-like domain-containing protein [Rosa chinensis]